MLFAELNLFSSSPAFTLYTCSLIAVIFQMEHLSHAQMDISSVITSTAYPFGGYVMMKTIAGMDPMKVHLLVVLVSYFCNAT